MYGTKYLGSVPFEHNVLPNINRIQPISRHYSKKNIIRLSQPKESKQIWLTSFGATIFWGTQDMMWPISKAALNAKPTERLLQLAVAKKDFQLGTDKVNRPEFVYSCGRPSGIWEISKEALKTHPSDRIQRLATPKNLVVLDSEHMHYDQYNCGRVSPIWSVTKAAKECGERPRTTQLSKPKEPHKEYQWNREFATVSNPAALQAFPSERVQELAQPIFRDNGSHIDCRKSEDLIWKVSKAARNATASARLQEISKPVGYPKGFVPNRDMGYFVSPAAIKATTSQRCEELSKPMIRASMDHLQFNPDAFTVKRSALNAVCSPRTTELAVANSR